MAHQLSCWIIYNGSLASQKFTELTDWLRRSLASRGVACTMLDSNSLPACIDAGSVRSTQPLPDFAVFWDKDIRLALQLESLGLRLFNSAETVRLCDDKSLTHIALANHGIPMPKTVIAPLVFPGHAEPQAHFTERLEDELRYPMVVKECFGSFGAQVYLAQNREEMLALHRRLIHTPHLYQQFIATSYGRDVRVQVVGGKAVAAVRRSSERDFRANVSNGGSMSNFDAPQEFVDLAVKSSALLGADFAGVDMLFGEADQPVLCEVNSNAHFKNLYLCTGVDAAEYMADHMIQVMTHA